MSKTVLPSIDSIFPDSSSETISGRHRHKTSRMSPKKAHEVHRMTTYISDLLETNLNQSSKSKPRHVVDIGAGQVSILCLLLK